MSLWVFAGGGVGADTPGASSAVEAAWAIDCCGHNGQGQAQLAAQGNRKTQRLNGRAKPWRHCTPLRCFQRLRWRLHEPGACRRGATPNRERREAPARALTSAPPILRREAHHLSEARGAAHALLSRRCAARSDRAAEPALGRSRVPTHWRRNTAPRCSASAPFSVRPVAAWLGHAAVPHVARASPCAPAPRWGGQVPSSTLSGDGLLAPS